MRSKMRPSFDDIHVSKSGTSFSWMGNLAVLQPGFVKKCLYIGKNTMILSEFSNTQVSSELNCFTHAPSDTGTYTETSRRNTKCPSGNVLLDMLINQTGSSERPVVL